MIADPSFEELAKKLADWERRRRVRELFIWMPRGLLLGLLMAALLAAAARFQPLMTLSDLQLAIVLFAVGGIALGLMNVFRQKRDTLARAIFADRQFAARERIATAVEIHQGLTSVSRDLAVRQLRDAVAVAGRVDTASAIPLQIERREWALIAMAILLLILAVWLPNPQNNILQAQRAVEEAIEQQAQQIEALSQEIRQNPDLDVAQRDALLEPLESALEQLSAGDVTREQAVATLSEAEADLRSLGEQNMSSSMRESLAAAGEPLAGSANTATLGRALQSGNLGGAGAAANALADALPSMSTAELAEVAADLAATAAALEGVDSTLSQQFSEAAEALGRSDIASAQNALREAAGTLQQRAQESSAAAQAQSAADQLSAGRTDVAQAGSDSTSSQQGNGDGQQGSQADGQGSGDQSADAQGQAGNGSDAGQGQGAGAAGSGAVDAASPGSTVQGAPGGPGPGGGHAERVYIPPFADLSGSSGVDIELPAECRANPTDCGYLLDQTPAEFRDQTSVVPYNQVFGDYRDAAYEALSDEYIPLGMKDFVRDYFSSLEPAPDTP